MIRRPGEKSSRERRGQNLLRNEKKKKQKNPPKEVVMFRFAVLSRKFIDISPARFSFVRCSTRRVLCIFTSISLSNCCRTHTHHHIIRIIFYLKPESFKFLTFTHTYRNQRARAHSSRVCKVMCCSCCY